ncbi:hypothetical protein FRC12_005429, partial [Ceratobasidium sp. 428]
MVPKRETACGCSGETYLVATGGMGVEDMVSKRVLIEKLVLKVPKGCTLHDVPAPKNRPASIGPEHRVPTHGSLGALSQVAPPPNPLPSGSFNVDTFSPPVTGSGSS